MNKDAKNKQWHIVVRSVNEANSDLHFRRTIVGNSASGTTVEVIGGNTKVHNANVKLAMSLAVLPNDDALPERAVGIVPRRRRKPPADAK